jgi:hypothetical protein
MPVSVFINGGKAYSLPSLSFIINLELAPDYQLQQSQEHIVQAPEEQADYQDRAQDNGGKYNKFPPGWPDHFFQFQPDVMQVLDNAPNQFHINPSSYKRDDCAATWFLYAASAGCSVSRIFSFPGGQGRSFYFSGWYNCVPGTAYMPIESLLSSLIPPVFSLRISIYHKYIQRVNIDKRT